MFGTTVAPGPLDAVPEVAEAVVARGVCSGVESDDLAGEIVAIGSTVRPGPDATLGSVDADPAVAAVPAAPGDGAGLAGVAEQPASSARTMAPTSSRRMPFILRPIRPAGSERRADTVPDAL